MLLCVLELTQSYPAMDGNAKKAKFQRALTVPVKPSGVAFEKPFALPKKTEQYFWIFEDCFGKWQAFSNTNADLIEVAFLAGHSAVYIHFEDENFRIDFSSLRMIQAPLSERKRKIEPQSTDTNRYDITWNITSHAWSQIPWSSFGSVNNNNTETPTNFESVHQRIQIPPYQECKYRRVRRLHRNPDAKSVPELPKIPSKYPSLKQYDPVLTSGLDPTLYHLEFGTKVVEWKLVKNQDQLIPFDFQTSCMIDNALETGKTLIHLKHNHFANHQATVDLQKLSITFTTHSKHNNNDTVDQELTTDHVLSYVTSQTDTAFKIQRCQSSLPFDWLYGQTENCQLYEIPKNSIEFEHIQKSMTVLMKLYVR